MLSETTMLSGDPITNIDSLPDELLFDILVHFPADYLYERARLVCRRWRRIIQYSDAFTATHIQQHSTYGLLLSLTSTPRSIYVTATQDGRVETSELNYFCKSETTANGLIVVESTPGALHVINPATKQSFLLPSVSVPRESSVYRSRCGIAYSAASMKYKVTLPYSTVEDGHVQYCLDIVTVGVDKSWRHVEIPPGCDSGRPFEESPLSSEGFLHWEGDGYCLTLNVETEIITRTDVPIPLNDDDYWYYYRSTGRYLSLLVWQKELWWEVWEMRPAESGEWRKSVLPNIDLEPKKSKLLHAIGSDECCLLFPFGWVKYPKVLAFFNLGDLREMCISYNLETHEIVNMIDLPNDLFDGTIVHRNSLVWLS